MSRASSDPPQRSGRSFTGRTRRKRTPWSVRFGDRLAQTMITIGGIGTIVAVLLVCVFLAYVVAPLFYPAAVANEQQYATPWTDGIPLRVEIDEYRSLGWALYPEGTLHVFRASDGRPLLTRQLMEGNAITAFSYNQDTGSVALGFGDGTLRLGQLRFETSFRESRDVPVELRGLAAGESDMLEDGVVQRTSQGQFRLQRLVVELRPAVKLTDKAILRLTHGMVSGGNNPLAASETVTVAVDSGGALHYTQWNEKENAFTGEVSLTKTDHLLPWQPREELPLALLLSARGDQSLVIWPDGELLRYQTSQPAEAVLAEQVNVLIDPAARLTACSYILGQETLLFGDSVGGLSAWFLVRQPADQASTPDGFELARAHLLPRAGSAITALGISQRSRMVAVGLASGWLRVYHVTTSHLVLEQPVSPGQPLESVILTPKDDGLLVVSGRGIWQADFDPRHPEATLAGLFLPVWYEGHPEPVTMWQSSFAGVGPEMKLGLWPLIFGTLKATFYSMLFGAPLALLAAVYTSEFVQPSLRSRIKPTIEMMASLPSVVLGFLAALVFAPVIEQIVPETLAALATVPVSIVFGAFLWQLLPHRLALRLQRIRLLAIALMVPLGLLAAWRLGPWMENWFFAGDVKLWLDGQIGDSVGAWMLLLTPLSACATMLLVALVVNPLLRSLAGKQTRGAFALLNLAKFLLAVAFALGAAYALSALFAWLLSLLGDWTGWQMFDPRGSIFGTYEQRNALVVGFVMGFAVIPIIYTIAEDALSAVPRHLRSASLGCGATPWQTAVRVVIPTAMSGLFSAVMIGLGRAVGETMIVLMAGGNTPVTQWNVFSGFRTLSANIAVELPEAVRNSTHFRTLFLAALVLFLLTFIVNTLAEVVRLRFRRRAYQL